MTAIFNIYPLPSSRISEAVDLVRSSFPPELLGNMIYGQHGIGKYLLDSLPRTGVIQSRESLVAIDPASGSLVAYAEFDLRGTPTAHLSYICVGPSFRGRGLATLLLDEFKLNHPQMRFLSLDVFVDNRIARSLYRRWGLEETSRSCWLVRDVPDVVQSQLHVDDLPQSLAVHEKYGFSNVVAGIEQERVVVGRLGEECLRMPSLGAFQDDDLLGAIYGAFWPERALLIARDDGEIIPRNAEVLVSSVRMVGSLAMLDQTSL